MIKQKQPRSADAVVPLGTDVSLASRELRIVLIYLLRDYSCSQIFWESDIAKALEDVKNVHDVLLQLEALGIIHREVRGEIKFAWKVVHHDLNEQHDLLEHRHDLLVAAMRRAAKILVRSDAVEKTALLSRVIEGARLFRERHEEREARRNSRDFKKDTTNAGKVIEAHNEVLIALAGLGGNQSITHHLRILTDQLAFCRIVYPPAMGSLLTGGMPCEHGASEIERTVWGEQIMGITQILDALQYEPSKSVALIDQHLQPFLRWNRQVTSSLRQIEKGNQQDCGIAAVQLVALSWPLVTRVTEESRIYGGFWGDDFKDQVIKQRIVAEEFARVLKQYNDKPQEELLDKRANIPLLILSAASVIGYLRLTKKDRKRKAGDLVELLVSRPVRSKFTGNEIKALKLHSQNATFEDIATAIDGSSPNGKEQTKKQRLDKARATLFRATKRLKDFLPLPLQYLLESDEGTKKLLGRDASSEEAGLPGETPMEATR